MRSARLAPVIAGAAAIGLASLLVASPASAATLPSGQRISVIGATQLPEDVIDTVYNADPATAALTAVGTGNLLDGYIWGVDVNDDGHGYAVSTSFINGGSNPVLYRVDANTGFIGEPVQIVLDSLDEVVTGCLGIDLLPSGEVIVACVDRSDGLVASYVGSVDPETGLLTALITNFEPPYDWSALAYDGVTGILYGITVGDGAAIYPLDLEAGTVEPGVDLTGLSVYGADFDRDGQLFVSSSGVLGTMDPAVGAFNQVGPYTGADLANAEGITVWGRPALPATGPAEFLPLGLGTGLLFLAGAAFIATHRIQRRAA